MMKLLVIDDEESTRDLLRITLESDGYEVLTAEDGPSGLEVFTNENPPIVLTDIKMPGMDGIEVLRRVKEHNKDAEVIVITGHGEMNLAINALQLEASDFINKPISDAALSVALRRAKEKIWIRQKLDEYTNNLEGLIRDTTEELEKRHELEHNLIQTSMDGIIANDRQGNLIIFNEGAERIHGYTREEALTSIHVTQLYPEGVARKIKKMIYGPEFGGPGRLINYETEILTKKGETRPILLSATLLYEEGREVATVGYFKDMREVKRLEQELITRYEFQHNLVQTSMDGIIANDRKGKIIIFNEGAERIYGYTAEEALSGMSVTDLYPKGEAKKIKQLTYSDDYGGSGRLVDYEAKAITKKGELVPILLSASLLYEDGEEVAMVGYFKDMRQIKRLEAELIESERMAAMGRATAGIAHGVKNILHGMKLGAFMVNKGLEREKADLLRKGWNLVGKNINRISRMTLDMLSYARSSPPVRQRCSLNEIVEEVCELMEEKAKERQIQLIRDLDPSIPSIEVDAEGIHSCLMNLVTNAIEAFPETSSGGQITVSSRDEAETGVSLQVKDTGRGMTKELQEQVFEHLYSTKGARGTGLGLAITQKIVREHGGTIQLESEPNKGSSFTIFLPK
ncbi:MAG: PAS domain S-box protein [Deltaproteobacteria bacterium]|nr:PAS domain S-box protein [Deltaproteobacteria bacterium]